MEDIPRSFWYRFWEILPGTISWILIVIPVAVAPTFPRAVAIFITIYVLLWFLRSLKISLFLIFSYFKSKRFEDLHWLHLLRFFSDNPPEAITSMEKKTAAQIELLRERGEFKKWEEIYHVAIIATYKEEKEILESTIESLRQANFPHERMIVVLATEERDRARAEENAEYLTRKFGGEFGGFFAFMHPVGLPHEVMGKGPNISYSGEQIAQILKEKNMDPENVLVTTLDADNRPHRTYFSNLTYHYLMEIDRTHRSYQPLPFFYNNIWEVPMWNRLVALASSFWHLAQSVQVDSLRNFSSHAQSLAALLKTRFWSRQTIVEDGHQYWRSFFAFKGNHEVVPLFIPIYQDAVQNKTYFSTLKGQYIQLRRWAWGASDIPYVALKIWKERRTIPLGKAVLGLFQLIEGHIMWATAAIVITFTNSIPELLNRKFSQSLFAYNLGQAFSIYFTIALSGILVSLWISLIALPPHPKGKKWLVLSMIEWVGLPLVTIFFSAVPAIDAQTRMMFNKPLHFVVTEKVRTTSPQAK